MLTEIPTWDSLHPLVIHFPIALLLAAPIVILLSLIRRKTTPGMAQAALAMMIIGTIGAWVAVATGEAAGELAERGPGVADVLERHEHLAELTRTLFTILTTAFAIIVIVPLVRNKELATVPHLAIYGAFLLLYAGGMMVLVTTAHQGGTLVHEYGIHAMLPASPTTGGGAVALAHD